MGKISNRIPFLTGGKQIAITDEMKRSEEMMRANYRLGRKMSEREWDKHWLRTHNHQAYLSLFGRP